MRWLLLLLLLLAPVGLRAQTTASQTVPGYTATTGCPSSGPPCFIPYGPTVPISGSFSATISGFAPNGNYSAPLSVTTSGTETGLPVGVVVAASNVGSNPMWINLGTTSGVTATTSDISIPAGCTVPLTVGSNSFIAGISTGGSTTLNLAGGSGLFTAFCTGGQLSGTVTVAQSTASLLNATVVGTGTFVTQATLQSGSTTAVTQATAANLNATVVAAAATPTVSASNSVTSLVLKSSAGTVRSYHAENATASNGYCILYNGTTAPSTGALTAGNVLGFQLLPASGYCDWSDPSVAVTASTGAVVLVSSAATPFTYTTGTITAAIYGVAQ